MGRNVYLPFIEAKEVGEIPEYIEVTGLNGKNTKENFEFGENDSKDTIKLSNTITDILGFGNIGSKIEILPLIDHRMFVMSINNQKSYFKKYDGSNDINFFSSFGFWFSMSLVTFLMFVITKIVLIIFEKKIIGKK